MNKQINIALGLYNIITGTYLMLEGTGVVPMVGLLVTLPLGCWLLSKGLTD